MLSFHLCPENTKKYIDCPCFIFTDGKLDVFQHNKLLTSITVWTTFGELAILYNCTRTASVRGNYFHIYTEETQPLLIRLYLYIFSIGLKQFYRLLERDWAVSRWVHGGLWWTHWLLQGLDLWPCGRHNQTNKSLMLCVPLLPFAVATLFSDCALIYECMYEA